jgi:hypothetical protein
VCRRLLLRLWRILALLFVYLDSFKWRLYFRLAGMHGVALESQLRSGGANSCCPRDGACET